MLAEDEQSLDAYFILFKRTDLDIYFSKNDYELREINILEARS